MKLGLNKAKYLKRYKGPNGEWKYVYKEGNKTYAVEFKDSKKTELIEDTAKEILDSGVKGGFDYKKTVEIADKATNHLPKEEKKEVMQSIIQRAMDLYEKKFKKKE